LLQKPILLKKKWKQTIFAAAAQMLEHEKQQKFKEKMKIILEKERVYDKQEEGKETRKAKENKEKEHERLLMESNEVGEELLKLEEENEKSATKK
jgi:hypothetical protein